MNNNQTKKAPKPGTAGEYIPHVNKGVAIAGISVFMALIIIPTLIWGALMLFGGSNADFMATISPDTGENRAMAKFPESFDPEKVTVQLENWYNDHLPFRSIVYNAYMDTTNKIEVPYETSIRQILLEFFATQSPPPSIDLDNPDDPFGDDDPFGTDDPFFGDDTDDDETEPGGEETPPPFDPPPFEDTDPEGPPSMDDTEDLTPPDFTETDDITPPPFEDSEQPPEFDTEGGDHPIVCEHILDDGVVETPATCTDWGVIKYTCTKDCGYAKREYTAKADHVKGEGVFEREPTCTDWGIMAYPCTACGKVIDKEYTAKADHVKGEGFIETPATCTDWGVMAYPCSVCLKVLDREYTKKADHDYVNISAVIPNCGESYEKGTECSVCGDTKTQTVVKKHTAGETIKTVAASYTSYGYTLIRCKDCSGEYRTSLKNKLTDPAPFLPFYRSDKAIEGKYQWLFYRGDHSEEYFAGTNLMTDAQLAEYVTVMTQLNELCKQKGIQLQICIWPNKEQVYSEYLGIAPTTNNKRVDRLVEYVKANSDVKIIYPLAELKAIKPYYDTYLKYDTHWNCAGGFVGYQAMLKSLGLGSMDIKNCPVFEYTGVETENLDPYYRQIRGDIIGMTGMPQSNFPNDHNYYVDYRPYVTVDSRTGNNGASDTRHTIASGAPLDYNFVMLGDSYRVMQLTYLERDFTDCFLTHRSHVNDADVKEAIKNADILVISAVERLEPDILNTARHIIKILSE